MGACFQALCAAPGQRPMETLLCLTFSYFIALVFTLPRVLSYTQNYQHIVRMRWNFVWIGCLEPLTISPQGQGENKNNNNNNNFWQQK